MYCFNHTYPKRYTQTISSKVPTAATDFLTQNAINVPFFAQQASKPTTHEIRPLQIDEDAMEEIEIEGQCYDNSKDTEVYEEDEGDPLTTKAKELELP
ncbi:hypothetical protein Tco_1237761 [Tanacetum coccineum]